MDGNLKKILEEFEQLKGQMVLSHSGTVYRLIAIGDDEHDYYYVLWDGRKTRWETCVGWISPLKGKIDDRYYDEFVRVHKLNALDSIELFHMIMRDPSKKEEVAAINEKAKNEAMTLTPKHSFLTEVCWDIN